MKLRQLLLYIGLFVNCIGLVGIAWAIPDGEGNDIRILDTGGSFFIQNSGATTQVSFADDGDTAWIDGAAVDLSSIVHDDNAAQGLRLPQADTLVDIAGGTEGYIAWDTNDDELRVFDGASWLTIGGGGGGLSDRIIDDDNDTFVDVDRTNDGSVDTVDMTTNGTERFILAETSLIIGDTTGDARGNEAIDLQFDRNNNSEVASGAGAVTIGIQNTASSSNDVSIGSGNTASGAGSTAIGLANMATGSTSTAIGSGNIASGTSAVVFGEGNTGSGDTSTIPGGRSLVLGDASFGYNPSGSVNLTTGGFTNLSYFGNTDLWIGNNDSDARQLRFYEDNASSTYSGTNFTSFESAGTMASDINYVLPSTIGAVNNILSISAVAGNQATLSWAAAGGASDRIVDADNDTFVDVDRNDDGAVDTVDMTTNGTQRFILSENNLITGDTTGDARGTNAIDIQFNRSNATEVASGTSSVAIGTENTSTNTSSVAIGSENQATGDYAVSIGLGNMATDSVTVAIGSTNTASTTAAVAVGQANTANSSGDVAIGDSNTADGSASVAIGVFGMANGSASVVLGSTNTASADGDVAIGNNNNATGTSSVAIGGFNTSSAQGAFSGGSSSSASAAATVAIGESNSASNPGAIALGNGNSASGTSSVAIGGSNSTSSDGDVAIGASNSSSSSGDVAIGNANGASGTNSVAVGGNNFANGSSSVAIGNSNNTSSSGDVAIGDSNTASTGPGIAIGVSNMATGSTTSIAIGTGNNATGQSSVAMGEINTASGQYATIPGGTTLTLGDNSFGYNTNSSGVDLTSGGFTDLAYFGDVDMWIGNTNSDASQLRFYEDNSSTSYSGTNFTSFESAAVMGADINYVLPSTIGGVNDILAISAVAGTQATLSWIDGIDTLQDVYDNDTDGGNAIISLTSADDSIEIDNPAAGGTDSAFAFLIDQNDTAGVAALQIDQAATDSLALDINGSNIGSDIVDINGAALTTGDALQVVVDNTMTTGKAIRVLGGASGTTEVFNVNEDGDTGIGTTPSTRLHVDSGAGEGTAIITAENNVDDVQVFVSDGTPETFITGTPGDIAVDTTSNPAEIYLKETGNGTTGWVSLQVKGTSGVGLEILHYDQDADSTPGSGAGFHTVKTFSVPAGTLGTENALRVVATSRRTTGNGSAEYRFTYGGQVVTASSSSSNNNPVRLVFNLVAQDSTTSQRGYMDQSATGDSSTGTSTVNSALAHDLTFDIDPSNNSNVWTCDYILVELIEF